jgi:plasmid stabilization system protein ParE
VDFQIRITEAALADFEGILVYSWDNFPNTAERFGDAILNHVDLLRSFPYIGSPEFNLGLSAQFGLVQRPTPNRDCQGAGHRYRLTRSAADWPQP